MRHKHRFAFPLFVMLIVGAGVSSSRTFGQEPESKMLEPAQVPLEAARVEDFAPRGWKIHSRAAGDLNGDGRPDVALILFDQSLDTAPQMSVENPLPALVIVFATDQGRWRRAGINTRMIVSDDSGFAPLRLQIKNGVVILRQELQSNISANTLNYAYTDRFRYEAATDRFLLIGEDDENTHRDAVADGLRVSDNYLTGERIIALMHAARGKYVRETNTVRRIERRRVFLEDAKTQDIDFDQLMDEVSHPGRAASVPAQKGAAGNWEWKSRPNENKEQTVFWVDVKLAGNKASGRYTFAQLVDGENDGSDSSFVPFIGTVNGDTILIEFDPNDIHGIEEVEKNVRYKRPKSPSLAILKLTNGKLEWTLTKGKLDAGDLGVPRQLTLSRLN